MQSSKEQSLIATYEAMDSGEIERRLLSGQLTPVAAKIARAELDRRPETPAAASDTSDTSDTSDASASDAADAADAPDVPDRAEVRPRQKINRFVLFGLGVLAFLVMPILLSMGTSFGGLVLVATIAVAISGGKDLARFLAQKHGEPDNFALRLWASFLVIPSFICGYLAVRLLTRLDMSGQSQLVLMIPFFAGGGAIALGVLASIGSVLGGVGRVILAMLTLGILYLVLS